MNTPAKTGFAPAPGGPKLDNEKVEAVIVVVLMGRVEISEPKDPGVDGSSPFVASAGFVEICFEISDADTSLGA